MGGVVGLDVVVDSTSGSAVVTGSTVVGSGSGVGLAASWPGPTHVV